MQALLKVWKEQTTLEEKQAWHRVMIHNGRAPEDIAVVEKITNGMRAECRKRKDVDEGDS